MQGHVSPYVIKYLLLDEAYSLCLESTNQYAVYDSHILSSKPYAEDKDVAAI